MEQIAMADGSRRSTSEWLGLAGRVCVVTGAGSGIGAETARQLANAGACVAVLDRDGLAAARVADAISKAGGRAMSVAADVASEHDVWAGAEHINEVLGACDVLVNNAAAGRGAQSLIGLSIGGWNQTLAVNLTGALLCAQAFAGQMIKTQRGGSIVNVASITGHLPLPLGGAYSVSKAGMLMMSKVLALELAPHGIRSNVVSPGLIRTPATESAYQDSMMCAQRERLIPVGRIGTPQDVANAIVFLASDRSSYINGQDFLADGGLSQSLMGWVPRMAAPRVG